jgi:PAS domain S-box-containing protein
LVFTGSKRFFNSPFSYPVIYLPPILLSIAEYYSLTAIEVLVLNPWGWERKIPVLTWFSFRNLIWTVAVLIIELIVCFKYLNKSKSKRSKKQAKYFIIGLLVPLLVLSINGMLLPKLGYQIPDFTTSSLLIGILFLGYGIVKYQLFSLTPERIAQDIITKMNTAFFLVDANKTIVLVNEAAATLFEREKEQMIGESCNCLMPNSGEACFFQTNLLEQLGKVASVQNIETAIQSELGLVPVAVSIFVQRDTEGSTVGYVLMVNDISKIKKTEKALITTEEKYKTVLESVMEGYFEVDLSGRYVFVNDAYSQVTGYTSDELIGKSYREFTSEETAKRLYNIFNKVYLTGKPQKDIRFRLIRKNKETVVLETSATLIKSREGIPVGFSGLTTDVSEKIQIEEMLIQSEKMMTLGGLSAGIAHEINNPLAVIIHSIQIVNHRFVDDHAKNEEIANSCGITMEKLNKYLELRDIPRKFDTIMQSGSRIVEIIDNILSFSRKGDSVFRKHDLANLLDNTLNLVAAEYDVHKKYSFHDILIFREYESDIPLVPCEGSKLQQVFFNLLKNSAQAMSENRQFDRPRNLYLRIKKRDEFVQIEVEDTGQGMDRKTCDQVFKPFYTTKASGIGLGLSISNYIVTKNHHGTMNVESQLGKGTKFVIRLPYKPESVEEDVVYN